MSYGIPTDRVILVIEGEVQEDGPLELGQECLRCFNATEFDKKLNVC